MLWEKYYKKTCFLYRHNNPHITYVIAIRVSFIFIYWNCSPLLKYCLELKVIYLYSNHPSVFDGTFSSINLTVVWNYYECYFVWENNESYGKIFNQWRQISIFSNQCHLSLDIASNSFFFTSGNIAVLNQFLIQLIFNIWHNTTPWFDLNFYISIL